MIAVESLHSGYGRVPVLSGISFVVGPEECVGILGHNGMGKTTLLRTLAGLLPATSGQILLEGAPITKLPTQVRARRGIGYVPQGREIFSGLTVMQNLQMGCMAAPGRRETLIREVLALFPRLQRLLDRRGGGLSGGEQQLLALARCLCGEPRIMLLDEPTEGIQPSIRDEIVETLAAVKSGRTPLKAAAILLVEQNLLFISSLADRILIIQKGRIRDELPPGEKDFDVISQAMGDLA